MSEMIERVARAICQSAFDRGVYDRVTCGDALGLSQRQVTVDDMWQLHRAEARAAIEAMREPTDAMCEAGAIYYHDNYQEGRAKEQTTAQPIWEAMVDAALKESEPSTQT